MQQMSKQKPVKDVINQFRDFLTRHREKHDEPYFFDDKEGFKIDGLIKYKDLKEFLKNVRTRKTSESEQSEQGLD